MNLLAAIRRRKKVWIRRLGAPVIAVWLTVAWQPCVMAMGAGMEHGHHCEHCPPPETGHCGDVVRHDCGEEDRFSADVRAAQAKSADEAKHAAVIRSAPLRPHRLEEFAVPACLSNPATAPPGRRLPVLFCAYLN